MAKRVRHAGIHHLPTSRKSDVMCQTASSHISHVACARNHHVACAACSLPNSCQPSKTLLSTKFLTPRRNNLYIIIIVKSERMFEDMLETRKCNNASWFYIIFFPTFEMKTSRPVGQWHPVASHGPSSLASSPVSSGSCSSPRLLCCA